MEKTVKYNNKRTDATSMANVRCKCNIKSDFLSDSVILLILDCHVNSCTAALYSVKMKTDEFEKAYFSIQKNNVM